MSKKVSASKYVWITWERQRRSQELSEAFNAHLFEVIVEKNYLLRLLLCSFETFRILKKEKPDLVFVQNPSLILAALACVLKPLFGYRLVVDRHSNFDMEAVTSSKPLQIILQRMSDYSLRAADMTIVTNAWLSSLTHKIGGKAVILPDKIPNLDRARNMQLTGRHNVLFISTFAEDEPLKEVIEAALLLGEDYVIYVTGNSKRADPQLIHSSPKNVIFTGYLEESSYQSHMAAADVVLGLTTRPHTLLCGAYEAVALGRPMVLSSHDALLQYFSKGRIATDNSPQSIASAIREAVLRKEQLEVEVRQLRRQIGDAWDRCFDRIRGSVAEVDAGSSI